MDNAVYVFLKSQSNLAKLERYDLLENKKKIGKF